MKGLAEALGFAVTLFALLALAFLLYGEPSVFDLAHERVVVMLSTGGCR